MWVFRQVFVCVNCVVVDSDNREKKVETVLACVCVCETVLATVRLPFACFRSCFGPIVGFAPTRFFSFKRGFSPFERFVSLLVRQRNHASGFQSFLRFRQYVLHYKSTVIVHKRMLSSDCNR